MSKNKITIRDVAAEAGVSVATVSYIINKRTDVKISEATRKKVLQVINLLNYSPNQVAKALASNKKSLLAFAITDSVSPLKMAEQMFTMKTLSSFFHVKGYDVFLVPCNLIEKYGQADAIICYDMPAKEFKELGDANFSPLIAVDSYINDPLFFQINTDMARLKASADEHFGNAGFTYVTIQPDNEELADIIKKEIKDTIFVKDYADLSKIPDKDILLTSPLLSGLLEDKKNVFLQTSLSDDKLKAVFECFENATNRVPIERHNILV